MGLVVEPARNLHMGRYRSVLSSALLAVLASQIWIGWKETYVR